MVQIKFLLILLQFKIPEVVIDSSKKFGSQCIVVAIDAKKMKINGKFLLMVEETIQVLMQEFAKKWKKVEQENY